MNFKNIFSKIDNAKNTRIPFTTTLKGIAAITTVASIAFGMNAYDIADNWRTRYANLEREYSLLNAKYAKICGNSNGVRKASYVYAKDDFENPRWTSPDLRLTFVGVSSRDARYGVSSKRIDVPELILGKRNSKDNIRKNVEAVYRKLPHIKSTPESVALVVETIIAETDGGRAYDDVPGNYGIGQFRIKTAKDMVAFLKAKHPDVHHAIMKFYDKNKSMKENLTSNNHFAIAMSVTHYWVRMGGNFYDKIDTLKDRAIAWKSTYNTYKGAGTVNNYIKRVKGYNV